MSRERLLQVAGPDGLEALTVMFGGQEKYVPRSRISDGHWLVDAVGREKAQALQVFFGGTYISVPMPSRRERDDRIRAEYGAGRPLAEIARERGLSLRQARRIAREGR